MPDPAPHPKPVAKGRRHFVRKNVPALERRISTGIVVLLAGIGVAIAVKGRHFDPGLYSLRSGALESTREDVAGKSSTVRTARNSAGPGEAANTVEASVPAAPESPAYENTEDAHATPAAPRAPAPKGSELEPKVAGLKPQGGTEFYNPDNLYEKINGRAPAYLGFNFQQLRTRSFSVAGSADSFVDVYEYRMDTPVNAFGIYALEGDTKGKPVDFAPDGYGGEMGYFFRQGNCYVQIIASDRKPRTMELALALAKSSAASIKPNDAGVDGARRLPATGLVAGSIAFVQDNALGQSFFKNVFQAQYQYKEAKLPFFLMSAKPAEAAEAWKSYLAFSSRFGKAQVLPGANGAKIFEAQSFGKTRVVFQRGGEVGGVFDATDGGKARAFVLEYLGGALK